MLYRGRDRARLARLAELAREANVPLIAVNDVLYHHPDRRPLADVLTCIREKVTIDRAGRQLAANAERHLKPPEEMARLFRDAPEAIEETLRLAEALTFSLDELRYEYPDEPIDGFANAQDALDAPRPGRAPPQRYPHGVPDKVRATIEHELALIAELALRALFPHRLRHRALRARAEASSARAAARRPIPPSATASASPRSIPTAPICCSSASSRRSGASRPTSTSISSTSGARR